MARTLVEFHGDRIDPCRFSRCGRLRSPWASRLPGVDLERDGREYFRVVDDDFDLDGLLAVTEKVLGRLSETETGILFVIPVTRVVGLRRPGE